MRFVFDTNVIVSAALFAASIPRKALNKALDEGKILVSASVRLELAEVLSRAKFDKYVSEEVRMRFLIALLKETELVEVTAEVSNCRDAKDNNFLELALSGRADLIVSGDRDLLVLNPFRGIPILTSGEFLNISSEQETQ